jgi:hypothetical protein
MMLKRLVAVAVVVAGVGSAGSESVVTVRSLLMT